MFAILSQSFKKESYSKSKLIYNYEGWKPATSSNNDTDSTLAWLWQAKDFLHKID